MNEIVRFKAFCLERYKYAHGMNGVDALRLFSQYGVMGYIESFYDVLHTLGDGYIIANIDEFIASRKIDK